MAATATKSRKTNRKTTKAQSKAKPAAREPKVIAYFQGKVQGISKLFRRSMPEFKNCKAICWLAYSETNGTVTFANSYNGDVPKASYDPAIYTYAYKPKVHDPKMEEMTEIDVDLWPEWVTSARKSRKTK